MAGPWEKFQPAENKSSGPWEKFSASGDASSKEDIPWYQVENETGRRFLKGGLESLPTIGMIGGGLLGTPADVVSGPMGTVVGAGLGGAAGKSLENIGEKYLLGEDKNSRDILVEPAEEALMGATSEMGGKVLGKGLEMAANTPFGKKAIGLLGKGAAKVGEAFTGVPEKEITTYAKHADEIKQMAKNSDNNVAEAADQIRSKFASDIDATRKSMNDQISASLEGSSKTIDSKPIIKALEESKGKINSDLYPEAHSEIDDLIKTVGKLSDDSGSIPVDKAHQLKQFLQDEASSAYRNPGQSKIGTKAANSAKSAAAKARELVNQAEPRVAKANEKLSELHDIEDVMNMNLVTEGKPEAGLLAAGSGGNLRNAKNLGLLGEATGTDMLGEAEKLAAMRTFGSPKLLMTADFTGKGAERKGLAALAGYLIGNVPGAVVAAALTSPAALRAAIDAGQISAKVLKDPKVMSLISRGGMGLLRGKDDAQ